MERERQQRHATEDCYGYSPNVAIDLYNFDLYLFKVGAFLRQCMCGYKIKLIWLSGNVVGLDTSTKLVYVEPG